MSSTTGSAPPTNASETAEKGKGKTVEQLHAQDMSMDEEDDSSVEGSAAEEAVSTRTLTFCHL